MSFTRFLTNCYKYKRKLYITRCCTTDAKSKSLKVLFFGTDKFSLPSLKVLHKHIVKESSLGVVTSFKSPANCVRLYGEQQKLPLYKWPLTAEQCKLYDLGVVVSFGHLIPTHIINAFSVGMINVHASLLPRWRGAAPIIYAIMNGDKESGVSIMRIEPKRFDIGDIFAQKVVAIKPDVLMPELHKELSEVGAELLWEVISGYPLSFQSPLKQNESDVTYAPKVTQDLTKIDWNQMTAEDVFNRYRSLYSFKVLMSAFQKQSIAFLDINLLPDCLDTLKLPKEYPPGSILYSKERKTLHVQCAGNTILEVQRLRVEGRKAMSAMEFNNGFLKKLKRSEKKFDCNDEVFQSSVNKIVTVLRR